MLTGSRATAAAFGSVLLALAVAPLGAQSSPPAAPTFYSVVALADGVTVELEIDGLLPVDQLAGLSSVTSEAHLGLGRVDALAALPDPGDLVLTLPGTLSGLTGVTGLPEYPAAAHAEHPSRPEDDVTFAPDGDVGAGRLHTEAAEDGARASAAIAHLVDTVGLLPSFSVGSIRTTAATDRLGDDGFRSTATTTIADIRLLGGLLRIDHVTSEVRSELRAGRFEADASEIDVAGVEVAGTPVGIGEEGIEGLGSATALTPVVEPLTAPLADAGITVRTTPATTTVESGRAVATGGTLVIEAPLEVQGRPGTFTLTLGRASAATEAGGGVAAGSPLGGPTPRLPAPIGSGSLAPRAPAATPSPTGPAASAAPAAALVSVPVSDTADWQVAALYRGVAVGALALLLAAPVVRRVARAAPRSDLRSLWRW